MIDIYRTGILTFHRASNYGACLQAYALHKVLSDLGTECEIIDYKCPAVERSHTPVGLFMTAGPVKGLIRLPGRIKKYNVFRKFRRRKLKVSSTVNPSSVKTLADKYDLFICGSDQVWNDRHAGFDPTYFLSFAENSRKYSYACSFGFEQFPDKLKKEYIKRLRSFRSVSVRELSAVPMLQKEGIHARADLDPTMLLTSDLWQHFAEKKENHNAYILIYTIHPPVNLLKKAKELSSETGLPIIYLNNEHRANRDLRHVRFASPEEFVGWFAGAQYVFTNSFHGTAFSVMFRKKFKVELQTAKSYNNRSRDLLCAIGLEKAILDTDPEQASVPEAYVYDWDTAENRLNSLRKESLTYLKNILGNAGSVSNGMKQETEYICK